MMIFQAHPQHGKHIAYTPLEAERNRKNGWKDVTEDQFYAKPAPSSVPETEGSTQPEAGEEVAEAAVPAPKKRRKPRLNGNGA